MNIIVTTHTHQTAPTQYVEANGIRFACRRFGKPGRWGAKRDRAWDHLKAIKQPVLVVNGSNDVVIYTINSYILQQNLPNAQLIIYPDSAHGSLF